MEQIIGSIISGIIVLFFSMIINYLTNQQERQRNELIVFTNSELFKNNLKSLDVFEVLISLDPVMLHSNYNDDRDERLIEIKKYTASLSKNYYKETGEFLWIFNHNNLADIIQFTYNGEKYGVINPYVIENMRFEYHLKIKEILKDIRIQKNLFNASWLVKYLNIIDDGIDLYYDDLSDTPKTHGLSNVYQRTKHIKIENTSKFPTCIHEYLSEVNKMFNYGIETDCDKCFIVSIEDDDFISSFNSLIYPETECFKWLLNNNLSLIKMARNEIIK